MFAGEIRGNIGGYTGIMEKKMETTVQCLGFRAHSTMAPSKLRGLKGHHGLNPQP